MYLEKARFVPLCNLWVCRKTGGYYRIGLLYGLLQPLLVTQQFGQTQL